MSKNQFFNNLKKRKSFIVRDRETLEEKKLFNFNYLGIIIICIIVIIINFFLNIGIAKNIFKKWLDPTYIESKNGEKLFQLQVKIASLKEKLVEQTEFIHNIKKHINKDIDPGEFKDIYKKMKRVKNENWKYSKRPLSNANKIKFLQDEISELASIKFFSPMKGIITSKFDASKKHYGIDIVGKENAPICSIGDGRVIFASWTIETGHNIIIMHKENLVCIYKHLSHLLKKPGDYVKKGEAIGIIGNSGDLSSNKHLHFEFWYMASAIDPEKFIILS